jgi:hypothetical protein
MGGTNSKLKLQLHLKLDNTTRIFKSKFLQIRRANTTSICEFITHSNFEFDGILKNCSIADSSTNSFLFSNNTDIFIVQATYATSQYMDIGLTHKCIDNPYTAKFRRDEYLRDDNNNYNDAIKFDEAYYRVRCKLRSLQLIRINDDCTKQLSAEELLNLFESDLENCIIERNKLHINIKNACSLTLNTRSTDLLNKYNLYLSDSKNYEKIMQRNTHNEQSIECAPSAPAVPLAKCEIVNPTFETIAQTSTN